MHETWVQLSGTLQLAQVKFFFHLHIRFPEKKQKPKRILKSCAGMGRKGIFFFYLFESLKFPGQFSGRLVDSGSWKRFRL